MMSDQVLNAEQFLTSVDTRSVVFISACADGVTLNGLSRKLVHSNDSLLVGFVGPVSDEGAFVIAQELYQQLLNGLVLGEAMKCARQRQQRQLPEDYSWASLVLFGDPTFALQLRPRE